MDYDLDSANVNTVEQFTNFNFAQAVAKILDNMGFSAATADALELLTSITRRYFDDLCQRIAVNKEHGNRDLPTLGDIHMAFKAQNVSLPELDDYMKQVQNLPKPSPMPEYPVQKFSNNEIFQPRVFNADPWAEELPTIEELEEKYSKKKQIVEEMEVEPETSVKMEVEKTDTTEKPSVVVENVVEAFNSWTSFENMDFPNFKGMSAKDLGYDMDLYRKKFAELDSHKKVKTKKEKSDVPRLFDKLVPHSMNSLPMAAKMDGLNNLVERIKKNKKDKERKKDKEHRKDKEHKKDKSREHKHKDKDKKSRDPSFLTAPILTPAVPLPSADPDSGLGDSVKLNQPTNIIKPAPVVIQAKAPIKTTNGESKPASIKPIEPIKESKVVAKTITPPPALEQFVSTEVPTIVNKPPLIVQPVETKKVVENEEKKEKRHKKDKKKEKKKKKDKDKDENRKRKHKEISTALPPVLEPSVQKEESVPTKQPSPPVTTIPPINTTESELKTTNQATPNVIPVPDEKPPTPASAPVRLKIRIGSTLSSDSMRSSPVDTVASKPHSPSFTPPILSKEPVPVVEEAPRPVVDEVKPTESAADTDEPPRKKHKKEKKVKKDKERESLLDGNEKEKSEQEKHKKKSKEHKEKKKHRADKHSNGHSSIDATKADHTESVSTVENRVPSEQPKEETSTTNEPLKIKLNKNGNGSSATDQQVKDILSVIKDSQEKKDRTEKKEDSGEKSHKQKKAKKEKKHKKERESQPPPPPLTLSIKEERPASSASKSSTKSNKDVRPTSENSVKLFEVPESTKLTVEKKPEVKKEKPGKPTFSTLENLKQQALESSSSSPKSTPSTSTKPTEKVEKKEKTKKGPGDKKSKASKSSDDVWVCPVCSVAYVEGTADMIGCDGCDSWFHFTCVGMLKPPPDNQSWYCQKCVEKRRKQAKSKKKH